MTVKELIKELDKFPKDANVLISSDPEGNGFWGNCEVIREWFHPEWKELVNIADHDNSVDRDKLERVCVIWVDHPRYDG